MKFFGEILYLSNVRKSYRTSASLVRSVSTAAVALGFGLGLSACSDNAKTAGGGPSGTEAGNAITAQILTADAKPAALAKVKVIDSESIDTKDAYTATADNNGKVVIEGITEGNYTLEASLEGKALQVNVEVSSGDVDLGSAKLGKTAIVSGKVEGKSGIVKVRGMDHSAPVINGSFDMDSLPAGPLSLVFVPDQKGDTTSTYLKADAGTKTSASTFASEETYLLLDDFQDNNYQNRFMPAHVYDGGWWYFDYDSVNVTAVSNKHLPLLEKDSNGNISVHVGATFGNVYEGPSGEKRWPWAVIGVELGKSDKKLCNDISSVDSVAFMVKGSGNIIFTMIDESLGEGKKEIMKHEFSLPETWTRYSVSIKDAIFPDYTLSCVNQLAWKLASSSVPATEENPTPAMDLWLDDIQLIGGNRRSIWEK